jgi:integrase
LIISSPILTPKTQYTINSGFGVDAYLIENPLLTIKETASLFRIDKILVVSLIKDKLLIAKKIVDKNEVNILIDSESIHQYLSNSFVTDEDLNAYIEHNTDQVISLPLKTQAKPIKHSITPKNFRNNNVNITCLKLKNESTSKSQHTISKNTESSIAECLNKSTEIEVIHESEKNEDISKDNEISYNSSPLYKNSTLLVRYITNFNSKVKTIPGSNGLKISRHDKFKKIFIRSAGQKDIVLIKVLIGQEITEQDITNIQKYYERFLLLKSEGMPCHEIGLLRQDSLRKLVTFNDFWVFGEETLNPDSVVKVKRMRVRYFPKDCLGIKQLAAFDYNSFEKYFLDVAADNGPKTDRDTIIKLFSAIYNKAKESDNIVKLDFPNFVDGQKRNRSDRRSKEMIELETYILHLTKSVELGFDQLALNLILQESILTRKGVTTHQRWGDLDLDTLVKEVPAHQNKNGKYGRLMLPEQLKDLLIIYREKLMADPKVVKDHLGMPIHLFPSPQEKNKDSPRANFDCQLEIVQTAIKNDIGILYFEKHDIEALKKKINKFSPHRLRDLSDALLIEVRATNAQKELAAGRSTNDVAIGYEDLTDSKIIELKTKKFDLIARLHPEYLNAIEGMKKNWKDAL